MSARARHQDREAPRIAGLDQTDRRTHALYTRFSMVAGQRLLRQLDELNGVLDFLGRMKMHQQTEVPTELTDLIEGLGMAGAKDLEPTALMPPVLDDNRFSVSSQPYDERTQSSQLLHARLRKRSRQLVSLEGLG